MGAQSRRASWKWCLSKVLKKIHTGGKGMRGAAACLYQTTRRCQGMKHFNVAGEAEKESVPC